MPNILEYKHCLQHLDKRRGRLHSPPSKYEKYNSSTDMDGYLSTLVRMEESDDLWLELESCSSKEPFLVLESSLSSCPVCHIGKIKEVKRSGKSQMIIYTRSGILYSSLYTTLRTFTFSVHCSQSLSPGTEQSWRSTRRSGATTGVAELVHSTVTSVTVATASSCPRPSVKRFWSSPVKLALWSTSLLRLSAMYISFR